MIRIREVRFWTAFVVMALSGLAIGQGATALSLALAERSADAASAPTKLAPFGGDNLVGDLATLEILKLAPPLSSADAATILRQLLSQTPLSSGAWLDLAIAQRAAGASTESVVAALEMSATTGPNELLLMEGRADFALPFWRGLPPDVQRSVIADLVGAWAGIDRTSLEDMLRNAPEGTREGVRAALLLNGGDGATIAQELMPTARPSSAVKPGERSETSVGK